MARLSIQKSHGTVEERAPCGTDVAQRSGHPTREATACLMSSTAAWVVRNLHLAAVTTTSFSQAPRSKMNGRRVKTRRRRSRQRRRHLRLGTATAHWTIVSENAGCALTARTAEAEQEAA